MIRLAAFVLAGLGVAAGAKAEAAIDLGSGLSQAAASAVSDLNRSPEMDSTATARPLFSPVPSRPAAALIPDLADRPNRTTIDYRLARNGLFGELGYFCLGGDPYVVPHEAAVVAGAQDGRRVGAALRYPFN